MKKDQKPQENIIEEKAQEVTLNSISKEGVEGQKEIGERREFTQDQILHQQARAQIENLNLDENIKIQAQSHANDMASLNDQEKIKTLLQVAKTKGVVYAVTVARKMDNPHVLDLLHDALAKNGYYKEFLK